MGLKMNVVPNFSYILQSLSVTVPVKYFHRFNQLCGLFLWNGKLARVRRKKPQNRMDQGG